MRRIIYLIPLVATSAFAQSIDIPSELDLTPYYSAAGVVLSAIFGVWIVRKLIKLGNRS